MNKNYKILIGKKWSELSEEQQCFFTEWFAFKEIGGKFYLVLLEEGEEEPVPILKVQLNNKPDVLKTYDEYVEECQKEGESPMTECDWQHETFREDSICDVMEYNIDADTIIEKY